MKLLRCKICMGEVDLIGNEHTVVRKVKCLKCGFTNDTEVKAPEIFVIKKRIISE